jgi:hypothetical protein
MYTIQNKIYQTGTVTEKRTELGASKLEEDRGFRRDEWVKW